MPEKKEENNDSNHQKVIFYFTTDICRTSCRKKYETHLRTQFLKAGQAHAQKQWQRLSFNTDCSDYNWSLYLSLKPKFKTQLMHNSKVMLQFGFKLRLKLIVSSKIEYKTEVKTNIWF